MNFYVFTSLVLLEFFLLKDSDHDMGGEAQIEDLMKYHTRMYQVKRFDFCHNVYKFINIVLPVNKQVLFVVRSNISQMLQGFKVKWGIQSCHSCY